MSHSAIAVFTGKTVEEILQCGGSRSWLLSPRHARKQQYLVCARNAQSNHPDATEAHGSAFLIGTISGIQPLDDQKGVPRWQISIADYALIDAHDVWKRWRNPVRYATLEDLGLSLEGTTFTPVPGLAHDRDVSTASTAATSTPRTVRKLTIAEAKAGLAASFDVSPEMIEITIRG